MQIPPIQRELATKIVPVNFPSPDREEIDHLIVLLSALNIYVGRFGSAVTLFEHVQALGAELSHRIVGAFDPETKTLRMPFDEQLSDKLFEYSEWAVIAASEAAMIVYHFGETLRATRAQIGRPKAFRDRLDVAQSKLAARLWDEWFPKTVRLRHALAHAAEHKKSRAHFQEHMGDGSYLEWNLTGRLFEVSRFRERLSIEVSQETEGKLRKIQDAILQSLAPLLT